MPNWDVAGQLACMRADGTVTIILKVSGYIESVGLDSSEDLYFSVHTKIYHATSAGQYSIFFAASSTILDFVFDENGDLYFETVADEIRVVRAGRETADLFSLVSGDGKLAISPDGFLVRAQVAPVGPASYQDWSLQSTSMNTR